MEMRHLRYLIAVVEERSISRAAARLTMSQPPLSTAIAHLERELGVKLLERHARGVEATEAGTYLVNHARRLVATLDDVSAAVVAVGTGQRGRIAIAAVAGCAWELLPTSLEAFCQDRPEVEIDIVEGSPADVIERVKSRRADVGVVYSTSSRHVERLNSLDLESAVVRREPVMAVLPQDHPAVQAQVDLASMAGERWLTTTGDADWPELADIMQDAWERAGIPRPPGRTVASLNTAVHLVAAGLGVALAPASVSRIAPSSVAVRPLRQHVASIESAMVWRRHERPSPVVARFLRAAMSTPEPDRLGPSVAREPAD
jgi:DNA-binding transcriptional LysR family regulator